MNLELETLRKDFTSTAFSPGSGPSPEATTVELTDTTRLGLGLVTTSLSSQPTSPTCHQGSPQSSQSTMSPTTPGQSPAVSERQTPTTSLREKGPNVAVADSNTQRQQFVPCKVCGDKASGFHYGVTSCEGCKGFFRRSIQKQIEYRCLRDGKCLVMRLNRNRCQYCRFKKCLAVGMSRDSVRYGRVPKRTKSQEDQMVSTTDQQQDQLELEKKQLALYDIILTVSQAHHANCSVTEDKMKGVNKHSISLISKLEVDDATLTREQLLEAHRCQMFQAMANHITSAIQQVVEFAKRIPGFSDLSQDDQLILIKSSFFEIWLTRMVRLFSPENGTLMLEDGGVIAQQELEIIYTPKLVNSMFKFAHVFSQLKLNDTELGLFTALSLATADRLGVMDTLAVERIQDQLTEALQLQVSRNHVSEPRLLGMLQEKLQELQAINALHSQLLQWFRQRWQLIKTPPLFAEIYDIQKVEEDDV